MKFTKINGSHNFKNKTKKYRPVFLKQTKFSKNSVLSYCNQVLVNYKGYNKKYIIKKIVSCPNPQNKRRKILTKSSVVELESGNKVKILSRVRHNIPYAEPI
jgi:ribosomal protein S8E